MQSYQRIFGTGPRGTVLSLLTLGLAWFLAPSLDWQPLHAHPNFGLTALLISIVITSAGMAWSLKSLPVEKRGRKLVTSGAFRRVRHPLYASFLLSFNFGLALYLDHWIYIVWAVMQFPIWTINVAEEERLMHDVFGQQYVEYCRRTGRFIPHWTRSDD